MPRAVRLLASSYAALCAAVLLTAVSARAEIDFHPGKQARLPNGRRLHYAEYGAPTGALVLYFHGTPGSHLEVGLIDEELHESGIRLLSIDRPGMGYSTYYGGRRITDWPCDVEDFLAVIGSGDEPFGVIALSGGAPYGLAVARAMPERVKHLALVSGHTPPCAPVTPGNSDDVIELIRSRPRLGRFGLKLVDRRLERRPEKAVQKVVNSWSAADRKLVCSDPLLYRRLLANLHQATACGVDGVARDVALLGSCWGFEVSEAASVPISIWQGGCDRIVTPSMAHYFHERLPGSELTIDPRAGHVTMFKWHVNDILAKF